MNSNLYLFMGPRIPHGRKHPGKLYIPSKTKPQKIKSIKLLIYMYIITNS